MGRDSEPKPITDAQGRLEIMLLGHFRVVAGGREVALPASRKARGLLAFLAATDRPHRRERLCELFWDLPDDPKASLRWSLSKLRKVVDAPDRPRILADRERVQFIGADVSIDVRDIYSRLEDPEARLSLSEMKEMVMTLDEPFLDGLDQAGDEAFLSWLTSEREDLRSARVTLLKRLARHPEVDTVQRAKWRRLWQEADPYGAEATAPSDPAPVSEAPPKPKAPRPAPKAGQRRSVARSRALRSQKIGFCSARDGTKIAHATLGSGPPLLKAANWLSHLEFDWSSPIWGRTFAAICQQRTFIRYDERGSGLSDWDVGDLSFDAFVEDLEAVADALELDRFPLLGISQGAAVSIEYAVRHPERVSGLILFGGYAAGWRHLASNEEQARREAVMTLTELGWGTDNPAYRHIFSQTFMPDAKPEDLKWFDDFQRQTTSPANSARFQEAFGWIDVRDRLSEVRVPTLVLHSRDDERIPVSQGRALASAIPGAQLVTLESRNHILVDVEPAWRTCMEAVASFIQEHGL